MSGRHRAPAPGSALVEARALERAAMRAALRARDRVRDWPRRRRTFHVRNAALVLVAVALALWVWPALLLAWWPLWAMRVELYEGSRGELRDARLLHHRAVEVHDRALTALLTLDPDALPLED